MSSTQRRSTTMRCGVTEKKSCTSNRHIFVNAFLNLILNDNLTTCNYIQYNSVINPRVFYSF